MNLSQRNLERPHANATRRSGGIALVGVVAVALAAAGCRESHASGQTATATTQTRPTATTTTTAKGSTPAATGRQCVLAAVGPGGGDPSRAMNECRDRLARVYGVDSKQFAEAWREVQAMATCLLYSGIEACTTAGG